MKLKTAILLCSFLLALPAIAQKMSRYDLNKPFGWAICSSLTEVGTPVTGGSGGRKIVLRSDGGDMRERIMDAIQRYDVVVLDGRDGDFIVSSVMRFNDLTDKTVIGINGARVSTAFKLSADLRKMLDEKGVMRLPSSGDGQVHLLSNGHRVGEVREWAVRQAIIDANNDQEESFRESGLFSFTHVSNVIIRNLTLIGPGAVDVGGSDLMTISGGSRHVWVDHCEFVDGMDGNFDINSFSDFITVSWCRFRYTENTYDHANTNLVGSNDRAESNGEDNLNITFAYCNWAEGCNQRMPMVRFGTIHLLNNLYTCDNCGLAVNPRKNSEVLLEGCHFAPGVKNVFRESGAKSFEFRDNIVESDFRFPSPQGSVFIPYSYSPMPTAHVMTEVSRYAGATLKTPLKVSR